MRQVVLLLMLSAYIVAGSMVVLPLSRAYAIENPGKELEDVGVDAKLGTALPKGLRFTSAEGNAITLDSILARGKPVVLTPVYYHCAHICNVLLDSVVRILNSVTLELGRDYEVFTVSFDSDETPSAAADKAEHYRSLYRNREEATNGWSFAVGDESNIASLMTHLGFKYKRDGSEFAHSPVFMILTPGGEISQYFTDINVSPWDVKLALVEASQGLIGSAIDHFLLYCFRFDPLKGRYSWAAWNALRVGSVGSVLVIAAVVFVYIRKRQVL